MSISHFRNPWSAEDIALALSLNAGGKRAEISGRLGRSPHAVRVKLQKLLMTPERHQARLATERRRYQSRVPARDAESVSPRPTDAEIQDRNRRLAIAPRDLTAAMFGDPLPGCSALERR